MKKNLRKLFLVMATLLIVLGMSVSAFAADGDQVKDGTYVLKDINCSMGMIGNYLVKPAILRVNGEDAMLVLKAGENVSKRFDKIYIGKYEDINDDNKDTIGVEGYVSANKQISFSIPLKTSQLSETEPLYCVVRYKPGYSADHDGDWYKAKGGDYYLTLGTFTPSETEPLTIENKTGMFKAVTANLSKSGEKERLIIALSGDGYRELYKGTYEEAVKNGTKTQNWIHGYKNEDDKWQFSIPLEEGETYVPVVAISNSYYNKYLEGKNPLERAFYPRQMTIDRTAKTLVTDDYNQTLQIAIENDIKMWKPGSTADLTIVGGPNSNNYECLLTLYTDSTSVTKIKSGETEIEKEPEVNEFGGYTFKEIPVETGKGIVIESWSAKNSKYYSRPLFIDVMKKTAYFADAATTVEEFEGLTEEEAAALAAISATPELCGKLIDAIYVQKRTEDTDALCAAAKAAWDNLTEAEQEEVEGEDADPDYFGRDTGDANDDDPLNQDGIGENELLVVSFGTSFNDSRAKDIGGIEKALAKANPGWDVRRAFTAQIIINHVQARDDERIDNMKQALDRAVENGVKNLIVQPTHLMHGAEYDELVEELEKVEKKFDSVKIAEPLLGEHADDEKAINADKEAVSIALVDEAVKVGEFDSLEDAADKGVAFVFMGHGTSHKAAVTYSQMQAQMKELGFKNVFIGTVEGKPETTSLPAVKKAVEDAGYTKVILRPLMVVAGDHANNDMAADEEGSWYYAFVNGGKYTPEDDPEHPVDIGEGFGKDNVDCQIEGLGRISAVQGIYVSHTDAVRAAMVDELIEAIYVQKRTDKTDEQCAAAKAAWDALTDAQKDLVEEYDYFGRDTGDAEKDDPLNQDGIGEKELLVVSFGTSFNDSRATDIGGIEKALAKANPDWSVRRAFTAQIIINHVQARDGEKIDNVKQALDRAVANGVKELVVQPTHLMHGAEYDELLEDLTAYQTKIDKISIAEPLLGEFNEDVTVTNADMEAVAKAIVDETVKVGNYGTREAADEAKVAFVFMGHGTSHKAAVTYSQMQAQMNELGFKNVFIGTVEGKPETTSLPEVKKAVEKAGYKKIVLRPLMVVAGDHANNDMAADEEGSWYYAFVNGGKYTPEDDPEHPVDIGEGFGKDNVTCQIEGLGRIAAVQELYVAHTAEWTTPVDPARDEAVKEAKEAIEEAEKIDTSVYSKADADAIKAALDALKAVVDDTSSTTDQIIAAKTALDDAIKKAEDDKKAADKKAQIAKVKKTQIKGVKVKAGKKKMTVTWKKNKAVFGGYKIWYKTGKKKAKTVTIKKATTAKKVIRKLQSKKVYKVKVRGFKKISGKTYYGKWSAVKKAKIK